MKCWYLIDTTCDRPPGICEGCERYEDWRKESEKMNRGEGYCPHGGMGYFTCPKCGCEEWVSYPQAVPTDRTKTWTYEYHCARCGKMMGLTLEGRDTVEELHAKAHSADPVQTDMLDEIYHSTDMSANEYIAHLKIIAKGDE